ncbi:MAG TPA: formate dehydrogenase accessory sulfurtransferase FdhD [Syntrophorhabdus sp.]|nr:MAG: formate dehydrogenase accessory protein [Deltaproteobacteria bacterium ADurb.Bin026]HNS78924.1 formate dehydrogenase accessory sulfurtransferase FdhD [Syntrophorhabdus sp.]HNZ59369.1 formate dehydrogenase accessory sulfurtransferase FdhD [Syntrophorhabdaceae bacterium]
MQEAIDLSAMKCVSAEVMANRFSEKGWEKTNVNVPMERDLTVYVNLRELVTILCTPDKLNFLVLGFLYSEGIISNMTDVLMMRVCDEESEVDVRLVNPDFELPTKRRLTSGCGGGAAFRTEGQRVDSAFEVTPMEVMSLMKRLQEEMELYRLSRGVHASALADKKNLLVMAEDIGRHNTLDKIQGECLFKGLSTGNCLLLSTGRISSEMLLKAARMQVPVIVSRHSPTGSAVSLARDLGISLVGRVRGNRLSVYSHPERLGCPDN